MIGRNAACCCGLVKRARPLEQQQPTRVFLALQEMSWLVSPASRRQYLPDRLSFEPKPGGGGPREFGGGALVEHSTRPVCGFIGLGSQGAPIARRIIGAGYPVVLWARREQTLRPFRG